MNLHEINATMTRYVWATIRGGNGRRIGGGVAHVFPVSRRTDVPLVGDNRRGWWRPWHWSYIAPLNALIAICGRIPSRAEWPTANALSRWNDHTAKCPTCLQLQPLATTVDLLEQADPWYLRATDDQPDPILNR